MVLWFIDAPFKWTVKTVIRNVCVVLVGGGGAAEGGGRLYSGIWIWIINMVLKWLKNVDVGAKFDYKWLFQDYKNGSCFGGFSRTHLSKKTKKNKKTKQVTTLTPLSIGGFASMFNNWYYCVGESGTFFFFCSFIRMKMTRYVALLSNHVIRKKLPSEDRLDSNRPAQLQKSARVVEVTI